MHAILLPLLSLHIKLQYCTLLGMRVSYFQLESSRSQNVGRSIILCGSLCLVILINPKPGTVTCGQRLKQHCAMNGIKD